MNPSRQKKWLLISTDHPENQSLECCFLSTVVLVLVFAVCWTPFHVDRLFFSFVEEWTEPLAAVFNLIHVVSGVFFYLSSAVNPIIYNLLFRRFQAAFRNVISPSCQ